MISVDSGTVHGIASHALRSVHLIPASPYGIETCTKSSSSMPSQMSGLPGDTRHLEFSSAVPVSPISQQWIAESAAIPMDLSPFLGMFIRTEPVSMSPALGSGMMPVGKLLGAVSRTSDFQCGSPGMPMAAADDGRPTVGP